MDLKFDNLADCKAQWRDLLGLDVADPHTAQLLEQLAELSEAPEEPAAPGSFQLKFRSWVMRDEDLKIVESVRDALMAIAATKFMPINITVATVAGIAVAVLRVARECRLFGTILGHRDSQLIGILKAAGEPLSPANLLDRLRPLGWDDEDVKASIRRLKATPTRSGP
ncbi:MAG: hypothetical protein ACK5HA_08180 [Planctomycetaceae bacterium]